MYELEKSDLIRLHVMTEKNKKEDVLKTKAMRDKEERQKRAKYSRTTIRVKFPDQTSVQGVFSPDETLASLYSWVREILHSRVEFELCRTPLFSTKQHVAYFLPPPPKVVTPPRRVLSDSPAGLFDFGLYPSAVIFLAWKKEEGAGPEGRPLKPELYDNLQDLKIPEFMVVKEEAASTKLEEAALRKLKKKMEGEGPGEEGGRSSSSTTDGNGQKGNGGSKPKWFKSQ